jgi:hypothetical protein
MTNAGRNLRWPDFCTPTSCPFPPFVVDSLKSRFVAAALAGRSKPVPRGTLAPSPTKSLFAKRLTIGHGVAPMAPGGIEPTAESTCLLSGVPKADHDEPETDEAAVSESNGSVSHSQAKEVQHV